MPPPQPRLWPTLVFGALFVPITWTCSRFALTLLRSSGLLGDALEGDGSGSFFFTSTLFQLTCLLILYGLVRQSSMPASERLWTARGRTSLWQLPLIYVGALGASLIGGLLGYMAFDRTNERAQAISEVIQSGQEGELVLFLVVIALIPGIAEELVFRGYIQSRLLARLPTWGAIGLTGVFFAIAHGDAQYALGIFPLGLWLGYVAFVAESIWPSVLCHIAHNGVITCVAWFAGRGADTVPVEGAGEELGSLKYLFASALIALAVTLVYWLGRLLLRLRRPSERVFESPGSESDG